MRAQSGNRDRARELRTAQTDAEGLLWSLLRSKQLCGLKFRRQHSIGPFVADFACLAHRVVVELDGDYHDHVPERDLQRQRFLEGQGWKVIRFANDDVFNDAEAVMRSIARQLGLTYAFSRRDSKRSGMMSENAPNNRLREEEAGHTARPTRPLPRPTSPEGR